MEWRAIPGYPEHEVSERGDVRRAVNSRKYRAGYMLKPKPHARGYIVYSLNNVDALAHRLVALAFLGAPPSEAHEVAHNDGTRTNNDWRNIRWSLPADNQADRLRHGTALLGERAPSAKVTDDQAERIRRAYAAGGKRYTRSGAVTMQALADQFGISVAQVSRIVNRKQRVACPALSSRPPSTMQSTLPTSSARK
jgi:hypothetical protein